MKEGLQRAIEIIQKELEANPPAEGGDQPYLGLLIAIELIEKELEKSEE